MIAAGCGDNASKAGMVELQPVHVDECAAQFECANGAMILVLDPGLGSSLWLRSGQVYCGVGGMCR